MLVGLFNNINGQCNDAPELPSDAMLVDAAEFEQYTDLVKNSLRWLISNDLDECPEKREELSAFVLVWLSGTPDWNFELNTSVTPFLDDHPDLLFLMIHGMAYFQMTHPQEKDLKKLHSEALSIVCKQSLRVKCIKPSSELKAAQKSWKKGKMGEYIAEHWK